MGGAYLNRIETSVPPHDIHTKFVDFAPSLLGDNRDITLFRRMAMRARINHRYSFLEPHQEEGKLDTGHFYRPESFPDTAMRMDFFRRHALTLACGALDKIGLDERREDITHIIFTTCTGFFAPGLDLEIIDRYRLNPAIERTIIGFMGCHAAIHALKLARHIVRSERSAKVIILNLEMCTLHLKKTANLEELLSFILFGDGCAASLVSAEPDGIELQSFHAGILPDSAQHITWHIGKAGFEMMLSGAVPGLIAANLPAFLQAFMSKDGGQLRHWAVHPGGRSVLDAVQCAAGLSADQLAPSRDVLENYGNMSSPSIMFVLKTLMKQRTGAGKGCALAFGPGLSIEAMRFETGGSYNAGH